MSSFQTHEFLALDRRLTSDEMAALRRISTRAQITPSRFFNSYSYGELRADPLDLLARYFDLYVHESSWGGRRLALRLPADALAREDVEAYLPTRLREQGGFLVIELTADDDEGNSDGWIDEDETWGASLAGVRDELLAGDLRPLYLAWLGAYGHLVEYFEDGYEDEEPMMEPPVPPGLADLTEAQQSLADFLDLDPYLMAAAAEASPPLTPPADLEAFIAALPPTEKDALLLRVARGDHAGAAATLNRRLRDSARAPSPVLPPRPLPEIQARAEELSTAAARAEAEREAAERRRREAEAAVARAKHLDAFAPNAARAWLDIDQLLKTNRPKDQDQAVRLLVDLHDLALRDGPDQQFAFAQRLNALRAAHPYKRAFLRKLDAGLPLVSDLPER